MFDRVVIGVDPGVAATGVAVVGTRGGDRPSVLEARTIRTPAGAPEASRLRALAEELRSTLRAHAPSEMALERLAWGRNVGSAMSVSRASGVLLLVAAERGLEIREYGPLEVKLAVTGNGTARKEDVRRMLARLLRIDGVPSEPDAADAVAVAVCHLHQARVPTGSRR